MRRKSTTSETDYPYKYEVVVIQRHGAEREVSISRDLEPAIVTAILEPLGERERIVVRRIVEHPGDRKPGDFFYVRNATPPIVTDQAVTVHFEAQDKFTPAIDRVLRVFGIGGIKVEPA